MKGDFSMNKVMTYLRDAAVLAGEFLNDNHR